ncbi:MAG: presqualene diphosphate synthase HpnD [Bacteroidota bacterium]|nr:presqualene diphosphate synthase HpnD [Bacteroidota bacterium]MDP4232680.1 presqualene diphosphate synthase HpnD [Bacteroidota bacterium]MDP4243187.1 presqualene diphosphate synthase HpnD [Bacteroidota bacterium]MDP4287644.1 presqualene diphosphate synthase HpnD [Bacteroidota bacterium]
MRAGLIASNSARAIAVSPLMDAASRLPKREQSSFLYGFLLLPREQREAMRRIYDFCRFTDDLVDESSEGSATSAIAAWREDVERCYASQPSHPILQRLAPVVQRYDIPKHYLTTLIDGVEMDLRHSRYQTFENLEAYCYAVASVVGLMSIEVFGYESENTPKYAVALGKALQLTNIIRDLRVDADMGRIYLPLEDLRRFEYSEVELLRGVYNPQFVALMKFEAARARQYYSLASELLAPDERRTMFPAEIMRAIYFELLQQIELADFHVFDRRVRVSTHRKLLLALRHWSARYF